MPTLEKVGELGIGPRLVTPVPLGIGVDAQPVEREPAVIAETRVEIVTSVKHPSVMAKLVFDIETSALPTERFDDAQQEYLFREAEKLADESARAARRAEIRLQFNLWPF